MGLGAWPDISLAKARELATIYRNLRNEGCDSITRRNKQREERKLQDSRSKIFKQCVPAYIEARGSEWKNLKHRQ